MKQKFCNLSYLLSYAWSKTKKLFLTTGLKNLFLALLPLANVVGIGLVVDALTSGDRENVTKIILFYVGFNLAVSILSNILALFDNNVMREASDITQLDYPEHATVGEIVCETESALLGVRLDGFLDFRFYIHNDSYFLFF